MLHIRSGSKKVILSVLPTDNNIIMIVLGVNDHLIKKSEKIISNAINDAKALWNSDITTELNKDGVFYEAEEYHQDYFSKNPNNAYCMAIIKPKLDKINSIYGSLLEFKV